MAYTYRCSICGEEIKDYECTAHLEKHKAEPDWPGMMKLELVPDEEVSDA